MTHTDLRDESSRAIRLARIMSSCVHNDKRYAAGIMRWRAMGNQ